MAKAVKGRIAQVAAVLIALPLWCAPALAQETPSQFNAANAENRRHNEVQNQLRNDAHGLRNDQVRGVLQCQGAGSAAARQACVNTLDTNLRRRSLDLDNRRLQQQNSHSLILKGIGVHRVP